MYTSGSLPCEYLLMNNACMLVVGSLESEEVESRLRSVFVEARYVLEE